MGVYQMEKGRFSSVFVSVSIVLTVVGAQSSLFAPRNFINYDDDPLFALLKDRLTDENPTEDEIYEQSVRHFSKIMY